MTAVEVIAAPPALELARLSNEELRAELAQQLALTAASLMRAAAIWTELQRRGVDLAALRSGLAHYLPRIARGELAPEAVVAFAGQRMLLQHLAGMPLADQRRYAAGEPITVAEVDSEGQIVGVQRQLVELTAREVMVALGDGRVRSLKDQTRTLARQTAKPTTRRKVSGSTARVTARDGLVHIGRIRLDPLDLTPALRALGFDLTRRPG